VRWKSANNHTMMVVSCNVVRNSDGSINPTSSYVTVLEQTSSNVRNERTVEIDGVGTVYQIYGVDKKYTFEYLYNNTYIPLTCMELIDASPVADPVVTDTQEEHTIDNLFEGTINSTWLIDCVTVTITDQDGKVVQQMAQNAYRSRPREFVMSELVTGQARQWGRGLVDPDALADGNYTCEVVCRLNTMEEFVVRDFAFTVGEAPEPQGIRGDMNNDGDVTDADALYLLRNTLFPDRYPITQSGDVNGDGVVTDADALYLLRNTLFPDRYPLQ